MSEALTVVPTRETAVERPAPRQVIAQATEEANALAQVIEDRKLFSMIQGRRFVRCEGWTTLACLRGCLPREVKVEELPEGRYVAEVELVRMSDGMVLTRASAECGGPEDRVWAGRPPNARRSMAITRATGKACRIAFSWVMALAGFEPTPAEEMTEEDAPLPSQNSAAKAKPQPAAAASPAWRGKLVKYDTKTGEKGGKPWTAHIFHGSDGTKFGTFDSKIAAGLVALEGKFVEIVGEPDRYGSLKILEYRDVTAEEAPFDE